MRFLTRSLVGMALLALTLAILALAMNAFFGAVKERNARADRPREARERVFTVSVVPVENQRITPIIKTFGEIVSGRTLELRAAAGGAIVKMSPNFSTGKSVKAGEFLFQTDPSGAAANLKIAQAELDQARADLREATDAVTLSKDELEAAQKQLTLREQALARQISLRKRKVGTEAALENAQLAASSAQQSVLVKRQAVANANARIDSAKIALTRKKIGFDEAQRKLDETTVSTKFDGVLSDVKAVLGGLVNVNERLATVIDPSALEVAFRITSRQYANLASATTTLDDVVLRVGFDNAQTVLNAKIDRVSASVGEGLTGRELFASLDDTAINALRPGDFVSVEIEEPALDDVALVPASAINASNEVLIVTDDNRLDTRRVSVKRNQGDMVIIDVGNLMGAMIVAQRAPQLGAGIRVEPRTSADQELKAPETVTLTQEQQAAMIASVEKSAMPDAVKTRMITRLKTGTIPRKLFDRLSARLGG